MEYTLNMVFATTGGKNTTFSVTDIKSATTSSQVNTLMDKIITQNIFTTSTGDLVSKISATIVAKTVTKIEVA